MTSRKYFLTPGPSELYFTVPDHMQAAMRDGIGSISHRSSQFQEIFSHTVNQLKQLLNVPENFQIAFTGSATEVWQLLIQNCTASQTYHLVNGSFSSRFYEFSSQLGRNAIKHEVPFGEGFDINAVDVPEGTEMICVTQNETSSGVMLPVEDIYTLREKYPEMLISVDAVSSVPYLDIDFSKIDSLFFSVQKGMGLPAGLGVWIFNERCIERCKQLTDAGKVIGAYHNIPELVKNSEKSQTQATPNVIGIYILGKVAEDMLRKGLETIRQETAYKASTLYGLLENHPKFKPFVVNPAHRSKTVIVADLLEGLTSDKVINAMAEHGLEIGKGYGQHKATQVRIANFPTSSKEIIFKLADLLEKL
ncbi:aminotransferase class V-fold PLP-dependent enzyme [Limibacter armeniacum]|uniref:aminotransferase class V-fold PLP-dependent enzyme n=1 Tax=Limibacter armeniacum TaxID=466084 RepID=UPI002FE63EC3